MRVRRTIIMDALQSYLAKSTNNQKILDFGCGSGYLVSELSKAGYEAYGLDVSEEAIQYGKRQGINNIEVIDRHRISYPDGYFQAVLALDVLEHLEDESWAIKEMERVLAPGGILVVMVPAFRFLWGVQDEVAHHFRRYTMPGLLKAIGKSSNLSLIRKTYFNTLLFGPIAVVRMLTRWFRIRNRESDFEINNKFTNSLFFIIFNFERKLLKRFNFPVGVSILAVFKKPESIQ